MKKVCKWCGEKVDPSDHIADDYGNYFCDDEHLKKYILYVGDEAANMAYENSVDK